MQELAWPPDDRPEGHFDFCKSSSPGHRMIGQRDILIFAGDRLGGGCIWLESFRVPSDLVRERSLSEELAVRRRWDMPGRSVIMKH